MIMIILLVMFLLKKTGSFRIVTVSVAGSVSHNAGQILVAMVLLGTRQVTWYFGVLCISGVVAGVVIGILTGLVLSKFLERTITLFSMRCATMLCFLKNATSSSAVPDSFRLTELVSINETSSCFAFSNCSV